jgi:pyochelin biosynthetic protein PchC
MHPDGDLNGPWFRRPRPVAAPRARLVCFPHAGGTAGFYRSWARLLPADVELLAVQYPGREDRINDPLIGDLGQLADRVAGALSPATGPPLALLGHSLGAKVAYEVALRLAGQAGPRLSGLVVSGHPGPGRERPSAWHLASDDVLCAELRRSGGTPEETLLHPELLGLILPILRNDYQAVETHRLVPRPALRCPVLAVLGDHDREVTAEDADAWSAVTTGRFTRRVYPGGHFYLADCREALLAEVVSSLWPPAAGPSAAPGAGPAATPGAATPAGYEPGPRPG